MFTCLIHNVKHYRLLIFMLFWMNSVEGISQNQNACRSLEQLFTSELSLFHDFKNFENSIDVLEENRMMLYNEHYRMIDKCYQNISFKEISIISSRLYNIENEIDIISDNLKVLYDSLIFQIDEILVTIEKEIENYQCEKNVQIAIYQNLDANDVSCFKMNNYFLAYLKEKGY